MPFRDLKERGRYLFAVAFNRLSSTGRYMPLWLSSKQLKAYFLLKECGLFDRQWYLENYPDVEASKSDPLCHFVEHGIYEGRVPNQFIHKYIERDASPNSLVPAQTTMKYKRYLDAVRGLVRDEDQVSETAIATIGDKGLLRHFDDDLVLAGLKRFEKFPLFSERDYLELNLTLKTAPGLNLARHAFTYGLSEGRAIFNRRSIAKKLAIYSYLSKDTKVFLAPKNNNSEHFSVVYNETGNLFLKEIAECIAFDLRAAGHGVVLLTEKDDVGEALDKNIIIAPHEFFFLGEGSNWVRNKILRKSIVFNTEQPQTVWFDRAVPFTMMSRGVMDLCPSVAALYAASGLPAIHCDFSGPELTDDLPNHKDAFYRALPKGAKVVGVRESALKDRAIDISFFGGISEHRDRFFTMTARFFSDYKCIFYCRRSTLPLASEKNVDMLKAARHVGFHSKIILNIHRDEFGYFESHRIVRLGMEAGAVVVSEPCLDHPYFKPNQHYFQESGRHIQNLIEWLLKSGEGQVEAETVRRNAFELIDHRRASRIAGHTIASFVCNPHSSAEVLRDSDIPLGVDFERRGSDTV